MLNTPVLFIIFNRPETTKKVFEAIRQAKPRQLFIAADGPRKDKLDEFELCLKARDIATKVDWDCEIKTLFRSENKGCGLGPAEAITWFFDHVEQGIILEDDCLPNQSFFVFCETLLKYYAHEDRVMHISGNNFQFGKKVSDTSYYFSIYTHNWGWATWRRAWKKYQFELNDVEAFIESSYFKNLLQREEEREYWIEIFKELKFGKKDIWDGQWLYSVWKNGGVSILPMKNLIKNIGFGHQATHTFSTDSILAGIPSKSIKIVKHPNRIRVSTHADQRSFDRIFLMRSKPSLFGRLMNKAKKIIKIKSNA